MKRLEPVPPQTRHIFYDVNSEPIVLSKSLLDILFREPNHADLIALYIFYYATAKWQLTNQPRATTSYVMQGLGWTEKRVQKTKKKLKELQLIEDVVKHNVGNKILGHYIKINFILHTSPSKNHPLVLFGGNTNKEYNNKINSQKQGGINLTMFEDFWKIYPKKIDKGKALSSWKKICNKSSKERPTWKEIEQAVLMQKKSERWQDSTFIPHPTTWLNQNRWLDDPKEMKTYKREDSSRPHKRPYIIDDGIQYDLAPDGKYRHCVTGEVYIP